MKTMVSLTVLCTAIVEGNRSLYPHCPSVHRAFSPNWGCNAGMQCLAPWTMSNAVRYPNWQRPAPAQRPRHPSPSRRKILCLSLFPQNEDSHEQRMALQLRIAAPLPWQSISQSDRLIPPQRDLSNVVACADRQASARQTSVASCRHKQMSHRPSCEQMGP
jgi:hypothetical protein